LRRDKRAAAGWQHSFFDGFQEGHFRGGLVVRNWLIGWFSRKLGRGDAGGDILGRVKMGLIRSDGSID
jgi:hypothetical protein